MTVKDVFELRKNGKTQEAWTAIAPMYAVHQGHYTTLAYFWTANDMVLKYVEENKINEAKQLLFKMVKVYPNIDDKDRKGAAAIIKCALKLDDATDLFNLVYFMPFFMKLNDEDWKAKRMNGHYVMSLGQRIVNHLFSNIEERGTNEYFNTVLPFFRIALQHNPYDIHNQLYLGRFYLLLGERDKAVKIFRRLANISHQPKASRWMAQLSNDPWDKVGYLCQAIQFQKQDKYNTKLRVDLAGLIYKKYPSIALYELRRSKKCRLALGNHVPDFALKMEQQLSNVREASEEEHADFYMKAINRILR